MRAFVAPGRVNLIGEHTDYSGGLVLPAAIDRGVRLDVEPADGRIALSSPFAGEPVAIAADGTGAAQGWGRYVAAMAAELDALGRPPVGLRGTVSSDLPMGAGLSSSAALEMAVGTALCNVADFPLAPIDLAAAGQRAEHRAVGVPVGIMDQAASVLGQEGHALLLDCASLDFKHVPLPEELAIAVVHSGVSRTLEGSSYAERRAELEEGLAVLGGRSPRAVSVEEAMAAAAEAGLADAPTRRLRHVVSENLRVGEVVAVLRRAARDGFGPLQRAALGRLLAEGHASMRDDFQASVPELDLLVELAGEAGAVAARMTGGGFGGAIVALVERDDAARVATDIAAHYAARGGPEPLVLLTRAARGAGER
jgi:galactokinase